MDDERNYLSVVLPIHSCFAPKVDAKMEKYKKQIKEALRDNAFSLNELAMAMWYKGITKKMSDVVSLMIKNRELMYCQVNRNLKIKNSE